MIYFDWAAAAPPDDDIIAESIEIAREFFANPSSTHEAGKKARQKLEEARERCARALGVNARTLFWTSGGTESDHIPLLNACAQFTARNMGTNQRGTILISDLEHPALSAMADSLASQGWNTARVKSTDGFISRNAIRESLTRALDSKDAQSNSVTQICVTACHNETGAVQPVEDIADEIALFFKGKKRPKFHVDAAQAAGKIPFNASYSGIDSASFCAHKIGGPRGIGLLYLADGARAQSFLRGGGQESGVRSGTENLFGAWAFSRCLERYYMNSFPDTQKYSRYYEQITWTNEFIAELSAIKGSALVPASRDVMCKDDFSPWIVRASFNGIPGGVMQRALDAQGFAVSTGSACSSKDPKSADAPVRFSFGHKTTRGQMESLLEAIKIIVKKLS